MLSEQQIKQIKLLLNEREAQLRARVRQAMQERVGRDAAELEAASGDDSEQSLADMQEELDVNLLSNEASELHDIEIARANLDSGRYGTCRSCQAPIGYVRLLAMPTAQRCLACQEALERASGRPPEARP